MVLIVVIQEQVVASLPQKVSRVSAAIKAIFVVLITVAHQVVFVVVLVAANQAPHALITLVSVTSIKSMLDNSFCSNHSFLV